MSGEWYFLDIHGKTQGPFPTEEMRSWYEAGYLNKDLKISQNPSKGFQALTDWFPNPDMSFLPQNQGGGGVRESQRLHWYFADKQGQVQGPFSDANMRQWHEGGYFEPTLQIYDADMPENTHGWKKLKDYFPVLITAFQGKAAQNPKLGNAARQQQPQRQQYTQNNVNDRFNFPDWLPVPPAYKGVKKVYPSERRGRG